MIVEGLNAVTEALNGNMTVEKLYVEKGNFNERINRIVAMARKKKVRVIFENKSSLDSLSEAQKHQGILAVVTDFVYTDIDEILSANKQKGLPLMLVLLDGIEDPHNVGAVIRACESAGADGLVIPKHRGASVNDTVIRISAGAVAHLPIAKVTNINDTIRMLKDKNITVLAADMDGDSVYKTNLTTDIAIVIGNEGKGVHQLTKKLADAIVSLPQMGKINSLNASVATGIFLYEAVRQRLA